ncbi:RIP metalloprotease RseP [uncultured Bacteroides sp.]|uniref:RIP metalloprotease RseP n=1 Tax=uncultured Bacteroides sp. TaxID=162156 RepID=UPI00261EFDCA|nr:RIP metalloprotease RseP [uncultured Bacteroides sp.]
METFLIRALQLIMSLSLLVIVHEGGHFLFARLFKTRVEKFCLFFDPWFTLFKFKPKNSDTEYGIGWLPLGGYVKIAGMIDESMDTEQMKQPMQSWEFRAKPAWQRLLIMIGGVMFNFFLALFIYSMILFTWGDEYVPVQQAPLGMDFNQTAKDIGFCDGDVLISADGIPLERMGGDLLTAIVDARQVTVLRNGQEASIYIPDNMMDRLLADSVRFADFRFPFVVDSIVSGRPAALAGLQAGDSITALNGKTIAYFDFKEEMMNRQKADSATHDITLAYVRNGVTDTLTLTTDADFEIGVTARTATNKLLPIIRKNYSFISSFPAGAALGVNTLKGYVSQMKYIFSKEGAKQLGGFGTIGSIFPATWDWHQFWYMTAFLSIILAFMNILPIPALDGGHVLFLIYEIIARRKPSDKFMEGAQMVGMFLLFGLLLWANFNDILRFFF